MALSKAQVAIAGLDDPDAAKRESEADADEQGVLFESLLAACRAVTRELTIERCANALDAIWSPLGRTVSPAVLSASLRTNGERNYFRVEWILWFAQQSQDVATLVLQIAGRGLPTKTPEDELRDLHADLRAEYPKQAERLIRKARAPR